MVSRSQDLKYWPFTAGQLKKRMLIFADNAIQFFRELTVGNGFILDTSNMEDLNDAKIKDYELLMMINDFPHNQACKTHH
jgi:uncharacterized protein